VNGLLSVVVVQVKNPRPEDVALKIAPHRGAESLPPKEVS
jgi:hypothetical protein